MKSDSKVLDACCGSRMFHFDKDNPDVLFMDNRCLECTLCDGRILNIHPDVIADFRNMPFNDEQFHLVIFDPPHLIRAGDKSWLAKKYGTLSKDWKADIRQGFDECMRVLKVNGTLVFKWNDQQVSTAEVRKVIGTTPLFGHRRGKTVWLVFFKTEERVEL